jgi:16S rRNA (guanine(966)-N(2))-methyltransferase RsmD
MRVVSGEAKGRRLKSPVKECIRPTADRVKETLFDIIGDRIREARVLDLFAGTGSLGIEALSRGARSILFVDVAKQAIRLISDNLIRTDLQERAEIWRTDALRAIARLGKKGRRFEIALLDPPYEYGHIERIMRRYQQADLSTPESMIVVEHHKKTVLPDGVESMYRFLEKRFGDTVLSFYQRNTKP